MVTVEKIIRETSHETVRIFYEEPQLSVAEALEKAKINTKDKYKKEIELLKEKEGQVLKGW